MSDIYTLYFYIYGLKDSYNGTKTVAYMVRAPVSASSATMEQMSVMKQNEDDSYVAEILLHCTL